MFLVPILILMLSLERTMLKSELLVLMYTQSKSSGYRCSANHAIWEPQFPTPMITEFFLMFSILRFLLWKYEWI